MSMNDPLANALSKIAQFDALGKKEVVITPYSKVIKKVLDIMNEKGYIGKYEESKEDTKSLTLNLIGKVNECAAIKPRQSLKFASLSDKETRYLPAKGFGIIIVSTNKGIMTHYEAIEKKLGGSLIAYCY